MLGIEAPQIISYIAALSLAAAIPGPGMTALVARSVSGGAMAGFAMLIGLILGDLIYLTIAIFGLALLVQTYDSVFIAISWAAALYLCFLAWQFFRYQPKVINIDRKATKHELVFSTFSGLTITLGNPKTIAFYLAILPLVISLDNVSIQIWGVILVPLTLFVLLAVNTICILSALKIRHFLTSEKAQRQLFRSVGAIMLFAAFGMLVKLF